MKDPVDSYPYLCHRGVVINMPSCQSVGQGSYHAAHPAVHSTLGLVHTGMLRKGDVVVQMLHPSFVPIFPPLPPLFFLFKAGNYLGLCSLHSLSLALMFILSYFFS